VLFGDSDPGGRLPVTFPSAESQLPTAGDLQKYPGVGNDVTYKEGVLVGYRWYDANHLQPAFPFGFGLSYTSFRIDRLGVAPGAAAGTARVSFDVTNIGARAGSAVPQLYVGVTAPDGVTEPPLQLRGFSKLSLAAGQTRRLTLALDQRALSYWDSAQQAWRVAPGCDEVVVGQSSRDTLAQRAVVAVGGAQCRNAAAVLHGRAGCVSRRALRIRLRGVRSSRVRSVTIYVNGRRLGVLHGPRSFVRVGLMGHGSGTVRVRIVVRSAGGRALVLRRTYGRCTHAQRR
jgi:hypothetical protein